MYFTMSTFKLNLIKILFSLLGVVAVLFGFAFQAEAQGVTMVLTVNGGASAQVINGQSVTLDWYIDGPVSNCSINNGVGVIDVSNLPATGTTSYTPPPDTSTSFILNCDGNTSSVTVAVAPTVTMSIRQGNTLMTDLTGVIPQVEVDYNATLANRCDNMTRTSASIPLDVATSWSNYLGKYTTNGMVRWDSWPHGSIFENTTFNITCYNDIAGTSATGSVTLTVLNPPPPADPIVNLWTNTPILPVDPLYGYVTADVRFRSYDTTSCSYAAYYPDGTPYASLPNGFGTWGGATSRDFTSIQIASTTDFEVTCGRQVVTIASTTYPAISTTERVRVNVTQGSTTVDRALLPPVTIAATATPSTVIINPITGLGTTTIDMSFANSDYCYLRAFRLDNDAEYNLGSWTRIAYWNRLNGNNTYSFYLGDITISTRLNIQCLRQYDADFYSPGDPEYENGNEELDIIITATSSAVVPPPPQTWMHGGGWYLDPDELIAAATSITGFSRNGNSWLQWIEGPKRPSYSELVIPFDHPLDASDTYDIYINYCDESDGNQNTFTVSSAGSGVLGSIVTDSTKSGLDDCYPWGSPEQPVYTKPIARGVTLSEGEDVTISCQNNDTTKGEFCRLLNVYFAAGSGDGSVINTQVSSTTGFSDVPLFWYSENAARCTSAQANPVGDTSLVYNWPASSALYGNSNQAISTSTEFSISCGRDLDGLWDQSDVTLSLPVSLSLTASTSVSTGQCIDQVTLTSVTAPPGYMPDPVTGLCVPAVDLAAFSPSPNIAGAITDNIFGTYDNLEALIGIENLGPGELPQNSQVSYMATIDPDPAHGLPLMTSPTGYYNATITAPALGSSTLSPPLTRNFNGVPFGTSQLCSRVNLDNSPNYPENNPDLSNNSSCTSVTLPVPPPPMSITSDRIVVRPGQQADITWSINVAYDMGCTVSGPGGISESFNTLATGYPYSDTQTTASLTSTSEFTFSCTEPITNTTFIESVTVEVVPDSQEI